MRELLNHVILEGIDCMFGFVEEDRCQLSNECFSMHVVLTSTNLIGHASIKYHVKYGTNIIDSFCSNDETKFLPIFHP